MKIKKKEPVHDPAHSLNPRGSLAKEIQTSAKRALALEELCGLWTVHQGGTAQARREGPSWAGIPEWYPDAKAINKAIKESGLFDRSTYGEKERRQTWKEGRGWRRANKKLSDPDSRGVASPNWGTKLDWWEIYDQYTSGSLRAGIEVLLSYLPEENRSSISE